MASSTTPSPGPKTGGAAEQAADKEAAAKTEAAQVGDFGGDDKALAVSGLLTSFTATTEDGTVYEITQAGTPVKADHLAEVRTIAGNHRVKLRTLKVTTDG